MKADTKLKTALSAHPFLDGFTPTYLSVFEEHASLLSFNSQQQIFLSGGDAEYFYLIQHGLVALETEFIAGKGILPIQTLGAGQALGWSWLFPPYEWHFSARAVEPTEVIAVEAAPLREYAGRNHDFGYALSMTVAALILQRLQKTRLQLLDVYDREL